MEEITLQALLEAGCHFGHKAERWHPKAAEFIYTKKDGIHIIDLVKTKAGLEKAGEFVKQITSAGNEVLFVATKRQAKGIVKDEAAKVGAPYLVTRWIGGFLTNWDQVQKNLAKIIKMTDDQASGAWKKFPKHEQVKMARYLERLHGFYGGVLTLKSPPAAIFVIDIKNEISAIREAKRIGIPIVAVVDTNADPTLVNYVIPANDDAVGSVSLIAHYILGAYNEGKESFKKEAADKAEKIEAQKKAETAKAEAKVEPKVEAKVEAKVEPKVEPKAEVKAEVKKKPEVKKADK